MIPEFRAWDKTNKIMIDLYGFCFTSDGENELIHLSGPDVDYDYFISDIELMQFTGLLDKNGKKIFEGDLLVYDYLLFEVCYDMERAAFDIKQGENKIPSFDLSKNECEVIGNIFENANLLEG